MKDINSYDACDDINSTIFSHEQVNELFMYLCETSELTPDRIKKEMGSALQRIEAGQSYLSEDIRDFSLTVEEIAFIIEHNRYQEKGASHDEPFAHIDVRGTFPGNRIFLISDLPELMMGVMEEIESILKTERENSSRLFAFRIEGPAGKPDTRILFILLKVPGVMRAQPSPDAETALKRASALLAVPATDDEIRGFIDSASPAYAAGSIINREGTPGEGYFPAWLNLKRSPSPEDISIFTEATGPADQCAHTQYRFQIWLPREKFQGNFGTVNRIFERRGLAFIREYFECFTMGGRSFIALSVHLRADLLTAEVAEFLQSELYNRLVLLHSTPLSPGEIKGILQRIRQMDDYEKLELVETMQMNRQKEYLVPLVTLLNEPSREIRTKAFGLIKHYLLNPTAEMKNDYYWSTLKHIMSAATVPFQREKDKQPRPLNDDEIIQLVKFSGVYFEDYKEPVTGEEYLFIRMTGNGIGKGGIRADKSHVTFSGEGALSTNMLFKTLGVGIPYYSAGKGGILGDISLASLDGPARGKARMNVLNAYADFLYEKAGVGTLTDVPAGDVGVGGEEIGIIFERIAARVAGDAADIVSASAPAPSSPQVRRLKRNFGIPVDDRDLLAKIAAGDLSRDYAGPAITGKETKLGLALRNGATGRGLMEVLAAQQNYREFNDSSLWSDGSRLAEALATDGTYRQKALERIKMLTFAIQGFGKVGASFARFIAETGASIIMISDVSGTIVNERGIPEIAGISGQCKSGKCNLADIPREMLSGSEFIPGNTVLPLTAVVNVIVPSALEDVIVTLEKPGPGRVNPKHLACEYVLQGANGPVSSDAEEIISDMGLISFPDILANSGGVTASYLEWLNGLIRLHGYSKIHGHGFVHPIVHNIIMNSYPGTDLAGLIRIDEDVYARAFNFILRHATVATIGLSRMYRIPLRTAYLALGISFAAGEGRLTEHFTFAMEKLRNNFADAR